MIARKKYFVSGPHDITLEEFAEHYAPRLHELTGACTFVVGDCPGTDRLAVAYLYQDMSIRLQDVVIHHIGDIPRGINIPFPTRGGYLDPGDRDAGMTRASDADILWTRPGTLRPHKTPVGRNIARRAQENLRRAHIAFEAMPRFDVAESWSDYPTVYHLKRARSHDRGVPMHPSLFERYEAAALEWNVVQALVEDARARWRAHQETLGSL